MKKLILLPILALMVFPAPSVQALTMLSNPDPSELLENTLNAESYEVLVDFDFATKNESMNQPMRVHVDYDSAGYQDDLMADVGLMFTDEYGAFTTYTASIIATEEDTFVTDNSGTDWYALGESITSESSSADDIDEIVDEITQGLGDLIEEGIIQYTPEAVDYMNGQLTVRYAYELDGDAFVDYAVQEGAFNENEAEDAREFLTEVLSVGGNVWIDTTEMLPVMITLHIGTDLDADSYTTFDFQVFFKSFNQNIEIEAPENAKDISEYESSEENTFSISSLENVITESDLDGDGLSNADEEYMWGSNPLSLDTDADGYDDYTEVIHGYDPNGSGILDSDGDGLTDYAERTIHWSNPYDRDSDNDGYDDGEEIANGYDPNGPGRW